MLKRLLLGFSLALLLPMVAQAQGGRTWKAPTRTFADLPSSAADREFLYCSDCQKISPCAAGGSGAFAFREGGVWNCSDESTSGQTSSIAADDPANALAVDDFIGGAEDETAGKIGLFGWEVDGLGGGCGATSAPLAGTFDHPGQWRFVTNAAASGDGCIVFVGSSSLTIPALGALGSNSGWLIEVNFKLGQTTDTNARWGVSTQVNAADPADFIGIRYDSATDTLFTFETCSASTCTESTTNSITADTADHMVRFRSTTAGQILFSIDNGTETTLSTNVPTSDMHPMVMITTLTTAAKQFDLDRFMYRASGLNRGTGFGPIENTKRVSTGSIAAGLSAPITITWDTAFVDTNYTVVCSVEDSATDTIAIHVHHVESITASAVVVRVVNDDGSGARTGIVHCRAKAD